MCVYIYIRKSDGTLVIETQTMTVFSRRYIFPPLFLERVIFKSEKRKQW